tara:strand:+ start:142 stop:543 length:402 start_codon:yes stop_codon:yes gene_type:complete
MNTESEIEKEHESIDEVSSQDSNNGHKKFCQIMIGLAFIGGILAHIGWNSERCDSGLGSLGVTLIWSSILIGFPINVIAVFSSLFDRESNSKFVITWSIIHASVWFLSAIIFADSLVSLMWCDACMGFPGEDC